MDESRDLGTRPLVFLHLRWRPLVLRWTTQNDVHHDLVFLCLPEHCARYINIRNRQSFRFQGHSDYRMRYERSSDRHLVFCGRYDDKGDHAETDSLATEG